MFRTISILFLLALFACTNDNSEQIQTENQASPETLTSKFINDTNSSVNQNTDFNSLRMKIAYGKATLAEIRVALTDKDIGNLANTVHALYSMRWHRGVINILDDMWALDKKNYPEISWSEIEKTPVRLAVASTINRIQIFDTEEYKDYLHEHKYDEHEFHRAQVIIALAFNSDPIDVDYLSEMADSNNHYVIQSAISGLGIMGGEKAKKALGLLWKKHRETPRGDLIEEVLRNAYNLTPSLDKPIDSS